MKLLIEKIVTFLITSLIKLFSLTYRVSIKDNSGVDLYQKGRHEPVVMAIWHNRLLYGPVLIKKRVRKHFVSIASNSDDGRYAANYMKSFNVSVVRGSSSRGGATALSQLIKKISVEKKSVVMTIDGPRGPKYSCKPGAPKLASLTGAKLVPYVINFSNYWQFKSWDNTQIPKPFCKVEIVLGKAIEVKKDLSKDELKTMQNLLIESMLKITKDREIK
ncbi:MAG: lysophospholipid acyltransferase family protein [Lentisphaeria bacterium]|nr:lysophospholipid acyltransferase family protein [Lentisphaeria bacterium]